MKKLKKARREFRGDKQRVRVYASAYASAHVRQKRWCLLMVIAQFHCQGRRGQRKQRPALPIT